MLSNKNSFLRQRIIASQLLKERGNRFYQLSLFRQAIKEYEQTLAIFTYIQLKIRPQQKKDENSNQSNFDDQQDNLILSQLRLKIYLNLAACYIGLKIPIEAIKACDYALQIDTYSVKAFYRRGKARLLSPQIIDSELVLAIQDLKIAVFLDCTKNKDIKNELNMAQAALQDSQKQLTYENIIQNESYQQQTKLYHSQEVNLDDESYDYSECSDESQDPILNQQELLKRFNYELSYEEDPSKPIPIEVKELGKFIETRGIDLIRFYEQSGRQREAQELKEKLKKAVAAKNQLEKISQLDFKRPKSKLQEVAETFGIDLNDVNVQNQLKKIQNQNLEDIGAWLKQNNWKYQYDSQNFLRSSPKMRSKGLPRHKCKYNKKRGDSFPNITQQVIYNQTLQSQQNILNFNNINNNFYESSTRDTKIQSTNKGCCGFMLNNFVVVVSFGLLIITLYSQIFK